MKTTIASLAAAACVAVVASLAAPHASSPAYHYGLSGNDWWAAQSRQQTGASKQAAANAAPVFQYGLMGNDWWAAQGRKAAPRAK